MSNCRTFSFEAGPEEAGADGWPKALAARITEKEIPKVSLPMGNRVFIYSSSLNLSGKGKLAGFVKSPSAALRFNFVAAAHL
jgi:hypothetical protein